MAVSIYDVFYGVQVAVSLFGAVIIFKLYRQLTKEDKE